MFLATQEQDQLQDDGLLSEENSDGMKRILASEYLHISEFLSNDVNENSSEQPFLNSSFSGDDSDEQRKQKCDFKHSVENPDITPKSKEGNTI